jgi:diguanylate cyclase (GGDEF)-like protein
MNGSVLRARWKKRAPGRPKRSRGYIGESSAGRSGPRSRASQEVLAIDRHKLNLQESVNEALASALLSHDKNLALILDEVEEISRQLKSNTSDLQALSDALHRSVLCAIKRSLVENELRSIALTDDLTSLYNRRAFHALATQQLKITRRKGPGLLLFFVDVDHLKAINDTYGHREGDLALVRTAAALKRTFRNSDIVARLGGDEFAVLALEASYQDQCAIVRRLEGYLQKTSADEPRYRLSVSVGVARCDSNQSVSLGDLLAKADHAMYADKGAHSEMCIGRG